MAKNGHVTWAEIGDHENDLARSVDLVRASGAVLGLERGQPVARLVRLATAPRRVGGATTSD